MYPHTDIPPMVKDTASAGPARHTIKVTFPDGTIRYALAGTLSEMLDALEPIFKAECPRFRDDEVIEMELVDDKE